MNTRAHEVKEGKALYIYVMKDDQWNRLHPAMIELITDLKFQGGYYAYDQVAQVNKWLIAKDNDQLAQFKAVAELFGSLPPTTGLSYMDDYGMNIGEALGNPETFFNVPANDICGESTCCNRVCLSFLLMVIKALEEGSMVVIVR